MTFKQLKTSARRIDSQNTNLYQEGNRSMVLLMKKNRDFTRTLITCLSHGFLYQREKIVFLEIYCLLFSKHSPASARPLFKVVVFALSPQSSGVGLKTSQNPILSHTLKPILPLCLFTHSNCLQTGSFVSILAPLSAHCSATFQLFLMHTQV